jgi:phosphate transport system substrate-binding protein
MLTVHAGTHGAYENVITGKAAMGLVARRPSEDELDLARDNNVEIDVEPVALDAFVFIMNYKNPVTNLSATQIRSIYSGKLKNWQEVGGPDNRIRAYRRNRNSGSQELMETLVMTDTAFEDLDYPRSRNLVHQGMGGPYIALTHDQEGIAYSVYYYEHFMSGSPNTRLIAVDGVMPSYETIRNRTYPYVTEVYAAVLQKNAANSPAARIRKWVLSDEGQAVVRESGYVPIKGTAESSREQQTEAM